MKYINGEVPFQVLAHSFSIGPSESGYTLEYSADGINYTSYTESTPANETLFVNGVPKNAWFRLAGNTGTSVLNY